MLAHVSRVEVPTEYCNQCGGEGMFLGMLKNSVGCFVPNCVQAILVYCEEFRVCFTDVMFQTF